MNVLTDLDRSIYEWQIWVNGFGEKGQEKLKNSSVLISRCGGLGGIVALELAAAGIGKMILAHGGNVKNSDLNRQLLMTRDWVGKPRIDSIERRLKELRPDLDIVACGENINSRNAEDLVNQANIVIDCAPLFEERYLMNEQAVKQNKPLIECAMYEMEGQLTTIIPGATACLSCLYPEKPTYWKRQFPVFGAVSGIVGCMAAMEAIKLISGIGKVLKNKMLIYDLSDMTFTMNEINKDPNCHICGEKESYCYG